MKTVTITINKKTVTRKRSSAITAVTKSTKKRFKTMRGSGMRNKATVVASSKASTGLSQRLAAIKRITEPATR